MRSILSAVVSLVTIAAPASAGGPVGEVPDKPPEESRLNTAVFRAGLKKRGLTELLELHLQDFPPTSEIESLLMMREVKLAESIDPTLPESQRQTALGEASRLLEQVIEEGDADPRRFDWRFTLAHSLIYVEAEPFLTNILYRVGRADDRAQLLSISARAVLALTGLLDELNEEYERIDKMSIREFDRLEAEGYIELLDRLTPRAQYLLLWALFYNALPRDDADPVRADRLHDVLNRIGGHPAILTVPHETSHVQVQTLVLAGMAHRLLNSHQPAREHLDRALSVAEALEDPVERQRIDWAVTLARLERIRNDTEDGRFDNARRDLTRFRSRMSTQRADDFGLKVVTALLERWVYLHQAAALDRDDRPTDAARCREEAWRAPARLAQDDPDRRDELYAALYAMIGPEADPTQLDPFEQCALIAGLLSDADRSPSNESVLLDRAVSVAEQFLADATPAADTLRPEVLYNLAVAQYRRGRLAAAAERFLEVARNHAAFGRAQQAATFAVQLAAELYGDPELRPHPEVAALYRHALEVLQTDYRDTSAARYWRFYYAQLLDELGRYDKAAAQYALVDEEHEHYLDSLFYRARCLAMSLRRYAAGHPSDRARLRRRTDDFLAAQRAFVTPAAAAMGGMLDANRASTVRSLLARARLLAAEVHVMPHVGRPTQALDTLADFEEQFPQEQGLAGRVWLVRLLAYERLGRLDEATRAIPAYVDADPDHAGPVLQSLYQTLVLDVDGLRAISDNLSAQRKAEMALVLATQIHEWAARAETAIDGLDLRAVTIQLAEANLRAGHRQRARELFAPLLPDRSGAAPMAPQADGRVLFGHAEALFQLGEFALALPEFNVLATGLPPADPIRWKALLRDLQCRTELHHPPEGIIKVIQQHKQLYPGLGGPTLAPQFEKLRRENERRLDEES